MLPTVGSLNADRRDLNFLELYNRPPGVVESVNEEGAGVGGGMPYAGIFDHRTMRIELSEKRRLKAHRLVRSSYHIKQS